MPERLNAAAAVVLRDADDAHPRDVVRNAIKELVAAGAWRIEHAVVKVTILRWEEQPVLVAGDGVVPDLAPLPAVHARLLKVSTVPSARGDGPKVRNLRITGNQLGGRYRGGGIVRELLEALTQAGYLTAVPRGGLAALARPRHERTAAGDQALAAASQPDREAGSRWWPDDEQKSFDALFDRWFDATYNQVN
jgi:hypothetical protein